jgi:hypothetical protein
LEDTFLETISLAYRVYGQHLFKPFDPQSQTWSEQSNRFYYDATMLGFNKHLLDAYQLMSKKIALLKQQKTSLKTGSSFFDRRWNK